MGLRQKLNFCFAIFGFAIKNYHNRLRRFLKHLFPFKYTIGREISAGVLIIEWFISMAFLITDLLLFPDILSILYVLFNREVRGLSPKEEEIKKLLFGTNLEMPILFNNNARLFTNNGSIAFVSFYVIHGCQISDKTFAHELIHSYQFAKFGSPYIIRALIAQRTVSGYNYGGIKGLQDIFVNQKPISVLNYEQQGDVLADYYELLINENSIHPSKFAYYKQLYENVCSKWKDKES